MIKLNGVKAFLENLAIEGAIDFTRAFLNEALNRKTEAEVKWAIENDIDLFDVVNQYNPELIETGRKLANRFEKQVRKYYDRINLDLVVEWLAQDQPSKISIIVNTPGGMEWLAREIEKIKTKIIGGVNG
jgi:restriction endonuclease Mrr